jgi:hypothetical protein
MPRGGKRDGAGRKKGALTKRTQEVAAQAAAEGVTPLEVMLANMRFAHEHGAAVLAKIMSSEEGEGVDALKELLSFRKMAQSCATDAAPYVHPRLQAIEHTGRDGKDLIPDKAVTPFELARYMAFMLEQAAEKRVLNGANGSHP